MAKRKRRTSKHSPAKPARPSTNDQNPVWSVRFVDDKGPWGREATTDEHIWEHLLPKLKHYESMTWGQIEQDKKHNHSVNVEDLISASQKRLATLKIDDVDELFRFRLSGKQRLWGIRDREVFQILWWDAEHAICPSTKK